MSDTLTVPGFEPDNLKIYGRVEFKAESWECSALSAACSGIRFNSVMVNAPASFRLMDRHEGNSIDLLTIWVSVRGRFDDLVRHGVAHTSWAAVAAKGYRRHHTAGFGVANVFLLKSGQYSIRDAILDNALDLIAPVLVPRYFARSPA